MKTERFKNVTVIIRSAHERTEAACRNLIMEQGVPEKQIFTVHEVPFSAAMKTSFEIGLQENRTWTYCIDADVLLRTGSIERMTELAAKESGNVCEIQGFVMDKFFGGPRQAGNHLYRTALLEEVIRSIPEEGINIRPERYTLGKMAEKGFRWKPVPYIVGLHDEEQYYADIYRKAYVHGVKHLERAELLITHWRNHVRTDEDFRVALKAFSDSIAENKQAYINREQNLYKKNFGKIDIKEKPKLRADEISLRIVEEKIMNWSYPELYYSYFPTRDGLDSVFTGWVNKVKRNYDKLGLKELIKAGLGKYI